MQWLMMEETVGEEEEEVAGEMMMVREQRCCVLGCFLQSVGSPASEWRVLTDVASSAICKSASSARCIGAFTQ